jgi:cell division septum initiation protein DivIVA
VLSNDTPYHEQFNELLDEIRDEVHSLNKEIRELKKENSELRSKLKKIQEGQTDIYSAISESERLSLRHQVLGLISKIDNHLDDKE